MAPKNTGIQKAEAAAGRMSAGVKKATELLELAENSLRNMLARVGNLKGVEIKYLPVKALERGLVRVNQPSPKLIAPKGNLKGVEIKYLPVKALDRAIPPVKVFNNTKRQVTDDAIRQIRNKGIKRLGRLGTLGALGFGAYSALSGNPDSEETKKTPSRYMYDPKKGWQEWNDETGQYENQQLGFGIDRYGNTNYYDGTNWLTPDQYLQGSNGYIYDKQTGQYIGTADDTLEAYNNGFDSVFDYRAARAGFNSPEAVKQLQEKLGINADGKWGQQTLDAFDKAASNWAQQYDPNSLFSIYQRKAQFGY